MTSRNLLLAFVLLTASLVAGCQAAHAKEALLRQAARNVAAVVIDANTPAQPAAAPAATGTQPNQENVQTCRFSCPAKAAQRSTTLRS